MLYRYYTKNIGMCLPGLMSKIRFCIEVDRGVSGKDPWHSCTKCVTLRLTSQTCLEIVVDSIRFIALQKSFGCLILPLPNWNLSKPFGWYAGAASPFIIRSCYPLGFAFQFSQEFMRFSSENKTRLDMLLADHKDLPQVQWFSAILRCLVAPTNFQVFLSCMVCSVLITLLPSSRCDHFPLPSALCSIRCNAVMLRQSEELLPNQITYNAAADAMSSLLLNCYWQFWGWRVTWCSRPLSHWVAMKVCKLSRWS